MQNPTFLFQFLTGIVAGLSLHFALDAIGQLFGLSSTTLYLHNFLVTALLIKWFLFARYKILVSIMIATSAIIRIYYFYDNPWWTYLESLAYSIVVIALAGLVAMTPQNWKKVLLSYGMVWAICLGFLFLLSSHESHSNQTINFAYKQDKLQAPVFSFQTYNKNKYLDNQMLKGKVTIIGFGEKVYFKGAYSVISKFFYQYYKQYGNKLQVWLLDVAYKHTWEETLQAHKKPYPSDFCDGLYISLEDSISRFAHDKDAAFVKAMKFKPVPLIAVFDKDGRLIYEITEVANEESAKIAANLLREVVKKELEK
jgi:hypothetical protein